MNIRYAHTNIIAKDWKSLSKFYQDVFDCTVVPPQRSQSGEWLTKGTGVKNAKLEGVHLKLPGYDENAPTLEIYSYNEMEEKPIPSLANRKGYGHIAFEVDNVEKMLEIILINNGKMLGEMITKEVAGVGLLTFVYVTDPEMNIIEIQSWS